MQTFTKTGTHRYTRAFVCDPRSIFPLSSHFLISSKQHLLSLYGRKKSSGLTQNWTLSLLLMSLPHLFPLSPSTVVSSWLSAIRKADKEFRLSP